MERNQKTAKKKTARTKGKRRFWKTKQFKWTMGILAFLIVAVIGVYGYFIGHFLHAIQHSNNQAPIKSADAWTGTDPVNIVLFGVDNRNNDPNPRSDSIIIVHIDPVTKKAKLMSVMRDTWYNIPDNKGWEKINAAMAFGGPDLAIQTLKQYLKIPINYYVKTDFQGFIHVVDALGGVEINVEKPLHYADDGVYDINLNAGDQLLDGQHALMYVRFRHDAMSDYARTERQRTFITALTKKMETPASVLKLPSILSSIEPYVETNMTTDDILKLAQLGLSIDKSDIQSMQVPPMEDLKEGYAGGGQAVLIPDVFDTQKAVYKFLGLDPSTLVEDPSLQSPLYYNQQTPEVPTNPNIPPDTPDPPVVKKPTPAPTPAPAPKPTPPPVTPPSSGGTTGGKTGGTGGTTGGNGGSTSGSGGTTGGSGGTTGGSGGSTGGSGGSTGGSGGSTGGSGGGTGGSGGGTGGSGGGTGGSGGGTGGSGGGTGGSGGGTGGGGTGGNNNPPPTK